MAYRAPASAAVCKVETRRNLQVGALCGRWREQEDRDDDRQRQTDSGGHRPSMLSLMLWKAMGSATMTISKLTTV
jgi:hypothetical protein